MIIFPYKTTPLKMEKYAETPEVLVITTKPCGNSIKEGGPYTCGERKAACAEFLKSARELTTHLKKPWRPPWAAASAFLPPRLRPGTFSSSSQLHLLLFSENYKIYKQRQQQRENEQNLETKN